MRILVKMLVPVSGLLLLYSIFFWTGLQSKKHTRLLKATLKRSIIIIININKVCFFFMINFTAGFFHRAGGLNLFRKKEAF